MPSRDEVIELLKRIKEDYVPEIYAKDTYNKRMAIQYAIDALCGKVKPEPVWGGKCPDCGLKITVMPMQYVDTDDLVKIETEAEPKCPKCKGKGRIYDTSSTGEGWISCPECSSKPSESVCPCGLRNKDKGELCYVCQNIKDHESEVERKEGKHE